MEVKELEFFVCIVCTFCFFIITWIEERKMYKAFTEHIETVIRDAIKDGVKHE